MISCVTKTVQICAGDTLSQYQIDRILRQNFKENTMCLDGEWTFLPCPQLAHHAPIRSAAMQMTACAPSIQKFAASKSDPALCP